MKAEDWIKVEDRLPDRIEGGYMTSYVLVYYKGYYGMASYSYIEGEECWWNTMGWKIPNVSHWMPIVPPKGGLIKSIKSNALWQYFCHQKYN